MEFETIQDVRALHAAAGATAVVHPLVVLNMCEHWTFATHRRRQLNPTAPPEAAENSRVFGVLLGVPGAVPAVHTSFEVYPCLADAALGANSAAASAVNDSAAPHALAVDWAFAEKRAAALKQVFKEFEVVGWYTSGCTLHSTDVTAVHAAFVERFPDAAAAAPSAVVLMVTERLPNPEDRRLPLVALAVPTTTATTAAAATASDSAAQGSGDAAAPAAATRLQVRRYNVAVESEETERIGIEAAEPEGFAAAPDTSVLVQPADRLRAAVGALSRRLTVGADYLQAVREGRAPADRELLRRLKEAATRLPRLDEAPELSHALDAEVDVATVAALAAVLTKGTQGLRRVKEESAAARDITERLGLKH
jgi:hypothetical protein